MPILAIGIEQVPRRNGFTLIELMVVVTIMGLLASAAVLAIPDPRGSLIDEAEKLAQRTSAVRDIAIMQARDVRVVVGPSGYGFEQRARGSWSPFREKPFLSQSWKPGTTARPISITFETSGLASEARQIKLTRDGVSVSIAVGIGGDIRIAS